MTPRAGMTIAAAALAVAFVGGGLIGWKVNQPKTVKETPAPAQIMTDGSLMLERRPDANARPLQTIPKGAKVERVVRVEVQPRAVATAQTSGGSPQDKANPAAVTVDLSLIRAEDGTRRVVASSPDGEIVGGLDVPVEAATVQRVQKWSVTGLIGYDVQRLRPVYGAMVSRNAGPFVVQGGFIGTTVFVGAGVRF